MEWLKDIVMALGIVLFLIVLVYGIGLVWMGHLSEKQHRENEYNIAAADDEIRKAGGKV